MARENAQGLRSYSLLNLARTFLKEDPQGLHAADEDVRFLWRVMEKLVDKKSRAAGGPTGVEAGVRERDLE